MPRPVAYRLNEEEITALKGLCLALSTRGKLAFAKAVETLPDHPACRQDTREYIEERLAYYYHRGSIPRWPESWRKASRVTKELRAALRGSKSLALTSPPVRRDRTWVDASGQAREIEAFDIYESDDVSVNEPFRWQDPVSGIWYAGRQTLATVDVRSAGFLGASMIARPKDAYRAEDIADHFLRVVEDYGLPHVWRLERGSWASRFVHGIEMADGRKWGSLDALFGIVHTFSGRGKGLVEQRFNELQSWMAGSLTGELTIGRTRGEFESATKKMRRVSYDKRRMEDGMPADEKAVMRLWDVQEAGDGVLEAMQRANSRMVSRRQWGERMIPSQALESNNPRRLPEEERWRFLPVKQEATVRRGMIEIKHPNYPVPFRFSINGVVHGLYLEDGFPVYVAWHPACPDLGATIGNRCTGLQNAESWALGEIIMTAPYEPCVHNVDRTTASGTAGNGNARRANNTVRQEYRAVKESLKAYQSQRKANNVSRPGTSEIRDGRGNRAATSRQVETASSPDWQALRSRRLPKEDLQPACDPDAHRKELLRRSRRLLQKTEGEELYSL